jgi:ribonuclease Z
MSYVTDSLFRPDAAAHVGNSDLFICEGMFTSDLEESAREKKHMTSSQAASLAAMAGGVERMGLIHYSPRYIERDLKQLLKEAREIFPETFLTRDGQIIPMPNKE